MECVTKPVLPKLKCTWCWKRFKAQSLIGRRPQYCSASCRQRAYEKRKWHPYGGLHALKLDLLPFAAMRRLQEDIRRQHMLELVMYGTVPLYDVAQISGILDAVKAPERMALLRRIETACERRTDETALATIARWRMLRQQSPED